MKLLNQQDHWLNIFDWVFTKSIRFFLNFIPIQMKMPSSMTLVLTFLVFIR